MKVLLLHPQDVPWRGEWADSRWDLIVDLAFAGSNVYPEWSERVGTRVISLHQFAGQTESYRWVNQALEAGRDRFLDRMGLDWWEILACWSYHELQALYLLRQLQQELGPGPVEFVATREHSYVSLLRVVSGAPVRCIGKPTSSRSVVSRFSNAARNLRPAQMLEIAFDKWDPSYRYRGKVAQHRRARLQEPVMLLPSAYSNVTRVQLAYAAQLPGRRFLLATTRRSGESGELPSNVASVSLSAYAQASRETDLEAQELIEAWKILQAELSQIELLRDGFRAGVWDYFPRHLENALRLRDAWQVLMTSEPVTGVLCADDLNYYTRLPLILAKLMEKNAVYCYHGALDGPLLFKKSYAEHYLVKGEMEKEYVLRVSEVEPARIEIGAPAEAGHADIGHGPAQWSAGQAGDLVLFSQPVEVSGGRADEIYRQILPRLVELAQRTRRKIVIKLHPFESVRGRERLLRSVLPVEQAAGIEVSSMPAAEIMKRTWCGIGVDSSVAVECTLRGVPYFLCGWLDFNGFGYMQQFARYGAGILLETPGEIHSIPERLAQATESTQNASRTRRLWQAAEDARLDEIMFGSSRVMSSTQCAC